MKTPSIICLLCACVAACGEGLAPEDIPNIDGTWTVTESRESVGSSCLFIGTMDIVQEGELFSAQFSRTSQCSFGSIPGTAAAQTGSIVAGTVGRETVDYRIGDCDYRGVLLTADDPEQMSGTILCATIPITGGILTSTGTWSAGRITD